MHFADATKFPRTIMKAMLFWRDLILTRSYFDAYGKLEMEVVRERQLAVELQRRVSFAAVENRNVSKHWTV